MARFPESPLFINEDVAEIIGVAFGIVLQFLTAVITNIQSEQSIASRSDQQMVLIFLQDIVDARHTLGPFQADVNKLVAGIVITVETLLRSHPEVPL